MIGKHKDKLIQFVRKYTLASTRRRMVRMTRWPPVGWVNFGSLSRLNPINREWGTERGTPIDRYYIEKFLSVHSRVVRGRVLEIGTDRYTKAYGGDRVTKSDVLHVSEDKPGITIVADLTSADQISADSFDCIILTQTLQFIYDVQAAIRTVFRILKPGGSVLVTVPGITQIGRYEMNHWGDYWRFTTKSVQKLFAEIFADQNISISAYGNVKASVAFLHGIAFEELSSRDLDYIDPDYELLITCKAIKP